MDVLAVADAAVVTDTARAAAAAAWPVRSEQALRASGPSTSACNRSQSGLTGGGDL